MSDDAKTELPSPAPPVRPSEPPAAPEGATPPAWGPRWLPLAVAAAAPILMFFVLPPLSKNGLWDPYELNVADLSRRLAYNLFGASQLALDGSDNSLPHLNDLGRPQLPFSSIGLGFKLFGLHEWAGRLPLALWGLLGVLATYAFVARLFDRRTGVYAAVALSTTPLYFVQARTMLGDVCTMAGLAGAFGGLAVAAFDRDEKGPTSMGRRAPWLAMAAAGLFVGFESRGGLLGLGVPLLGVGLGWAASRVAVQARAQDRDPLGMAVGVGSLVVGAFVAVMAVRAVAAEGKDLDLWAGTVFHLQAKYPTYDFYVGAIGHAMAPWSAFLPFAFGRILFAPSRGATPVDDRESFGRVAVVIAAAVAFTAHGYLAARTDLVAFSGPALCAVVCAVALRDFERGAPASIAVGLGTLIIAAVLHHDLHELPEKAYQAFGITGATFPEGFKATALNLWWVALGGFALCALLTWIERDAAREPFDPANYAKVLRALRESYDGLLVFFYFAVVAGLAIAGLGVLLGTRMHAHWLPQMSSTLRDVIVDYAWWAVAVLPLGAIFGLLFACDVWVWTFGRSKPLTGASFTRGFEPFETLFARFGARAGEKQAKPQDEAANDEWWVTVLVVAPLLLVAIPAVVCFGAIAAGAKVLVAVPLALPSGIAFFLVMGVLGDALRYRASGLAVGGAVVGVVLCCFYYPALANQLSPKEVFESYRQVCPGANLGLLGVGGRTSAYYAGGQPQTLNDPTSAFQWLVGGGTQRRCLALKADELPKLNQLWRERAPEPRTNLPIVDARSSQILLASSSLENPDKNENPLASMVLTAPPHFWRKIDANMDDKLEVLGIDLLDDSGRLVDAVSPGKTYHLKTYYRVLALVGTEWEAFIHIDGYHRRHNGDHKPLNGKYPMSLWLAGDLIADDHEFKLEPNFSPGNYTIFFGLYAGDTRLKVKSGPNDGDNRINGGALRVQ
jgi:4-amino-4-deoxy-L-arabinose transferase-like glycosyltransferase